MTSLMYYSYIQKKTYMPVSIRISQHLQLKPSNTSHHPNISLFEDPCRSQAREGLHRICMSYTHLPSSGSRINHLKKTRTHKLSWHINATCSFKSNKKPLFNKMFDFHLLCIAIQSWFACCSSEKKKRPSSSVDSPPVVPTPSVVLPVALGSPRSA